MTPIPISTRADARPSETADHTSMKSVPPLPKRRSLIPSALAPRIRPQKDTIARPIIRPATTPQSAMIPNDIHLNSARQRPGSNAISCQDLHGALHRDLGTDKAKLLIEILETFSRGAQYPRYVGIVAHHGLHECTSYPLASMAFRDHEHRM